MTELVSADERAFFHANGYLVFDPGIAPQTIAGAVADLEARFDRSPSLPGLLNAHRLRNAWRASGDVKRIALAARILEVLRGLYGREPLAFQTLNFLVGTEQPAHADTMHFASRPAGFVCGVWVALEDMDGDNGPLVYYPGTHLWPEPRMEELGLASSKRDYPRYEETLARRLKDSGIAAEHALLRRGQAVLWHGNLAHGGSPRHDRQRTRLSQVTHFIFSGCRFYTPMRSRGERLFVRNPRPIRDRETLGQVLAWGAGYLSPWFLANLFGRNLPHLVRSELLRRE